MTRLLLWPLLLVLACVVVMAQLDRQARYEREYAPYVPGAFRGFAYPHLVRAALADGRTGDGLSLAKTMVAVRPMTAENLSLLAEAAFAAGDVPLATAALAEAAVRGWRAPLPQVFMLENALQAGDMQIASQRLVALIGRGSRGEIVERGLVLVLTSEEGRAAFAERLAAGGKWSSNFPVRASRLVPPADLSDTLARAERLGARLPCGRLANVRRYFRRLDFAEEARMVLPARCGRPG